MVDFVLLTDANGKKIGQDTLARVHAVYRHDRCIF